MTKRDELVYPDIKGKKRKIAEEIASPEFDGNISKLCQEYKISRSTYYRWLENSRFVAYCEWQIDRYTDSELANMWKSLIDAGKKGSIEAIKLYFELKGKFVKKVDISGNVVVIGGEDELE